MEEMQVSGNSITEETQVSLGIQPRKRPKTLWEFKHGRDASLFGNSIMEDTQVSGNSTMEEM